MYSLVAGQAIFLARASGAPPECMQGTTGGHLIDLIERAGRWA